MIQTTGRAVHVFPLNTFSANSPLPHRWIGGFITAHGVAKICSVLVCGTRLLAQQGGAPDRIYVNGTVITMDGAARVVQAVAIRGDRIAAAGPDAQIRNMAGPNTVVVDLSGKTLLPGLIDAHSHFPGSGTSARVRPSPARTCSPSP